MGQDLKVSGVQTHDDENRVRWITLNRPQASNATTLADLDHMSRLVSTQLPRPKAVVFTGTGRKSICAGMRLDDESNRRVHG